MGTSNRKTGWRLIRVALGLLLLSGALAGLSSGDEKIDLERAKELFKKAQQGIKLTPEEQKYLDRAKEEYKKSNAPEKRDDTIDVERAKALFKKQQRGDKLTPEEQKYLDRAREAFKKSNAPRSSGDKFDFARVRELYEKSLKGVKLTPEEVKYLDRARAELQKPNSSGSSTLKKGEHSSVGLKPLTDMTAQDRYKGEDGGLYGGGRNEPPTAHRLAAERELKRIAPLDAQGHPSRDGKIGFLSIGMSNTVGEFMAFKLLADEDPQKSPQVVIVNGAVAGAGASSWTSRTADAWSTVAQRLSDSQVTPEQVQVVWIKHADPFPSPDSSPLEYARKLQSNLLVILHLLKSHYPNLRVAYLSSRIYGGYNAAGRRLVNPEPFAYETAFSARWLILDQVKGDPRLNYDPKKGAVVCPLLLWGPYLWADGVTPRKLDGLVWERREFGDDGVHPSLSGGQKVGSLLLKFFKTDGGARTWFLKK
jgi:hypothetical protein